jgi:myo-inositol-1(or 4)-monophosphatase
MTPLPDHLARRLEFAITLARDCGALARREAAQLQVSSKGAHDVLTQADLAVEQLVRQQVAARFAGDLVVGEEMGGQAQVGSAGNFWLVDPIDGTANYATDVPRWCISIAYLEAGQPVLGVLYDPMMDRLYSAGLNTGAWLNDRPIRARDTRSLQGATVELGWSTRRPPEVYLAKAAALLNAGCAFTRRGSGALGLADVAAGRVDGYAELHINAWDCAAGVLLVTEAGGQVNDFFTPEGLQSGGLLVACARGLFDELMGLMSAGVSRGH